jgi:hypothetical protein
MEEDKFEVVVVVIPTSKFENLARSVDSWALLNDEPVGFELAEVISESVERYWKSL